MALVTSTKLDPATTLKKSIRASNHVAVLTVGVPVDSGDGYEYHTFDLREIARGQWDLYIIPAAGDVIYTLAGIYEHDSSGDPDATKKVSRLTDTTVSNPAIAVRTVNEAIPYLLLGVKVTGTTSTSTKFILSTVA